jgi:flagellar basal-body rod modification protein FlgD
MNIGNVNSVTWPLGTEDNRASGAESVLDRDAFLRLLVTQLRYQNPINPLSNEEFISQTAQFSSLEQLQNLSESLNTLTELQRSSSGMELLNLVGKHVVAESSAFSMSGGSPVNLNYSLSADANVTITIYSNDGVPVRTMDVGSQSRGDHSFVWNGLSDRGVRMPDGNYTYLVSAMDDNGNDVGVSENISGIVSSVMLGGEPRISIGGLYIPIQALKQVSLAPLES